MSANVPPGNNLSLESVFSNAREEPGVMTHERVRMFLQAGDSPPDGPDDADLENHVYKQYLAYTALKIGVTGGTKTQSTTTPGYKRYFKNLFNIYQKDSDRTQLPTFEGWQINFQTEEAAIFPMPPFGTNNPASVPDPDHKYAVTL
jgi:hypothetical protein